MYINDINIGGNNQASKAVTVTSNGTTTITPDSGYDALEKVDLTVNVGDTAGSSTTSLQIHAEENGRDIPFGAVYQTLNGEWLWRKTLETAESTTLNDVLIGGIVILYADPMSDSMEFYLSVYSLNVVDINSTDADDGSYSPGLICRVTGENPVIDYNIV